MTGNAIAFFRRRFAASLAVAALALAAASLVAFLMDVSFCGGIRAVSVEDLSLDSAKLVRCRRSGDEISSVGSDAQLVWELDGRVARSGYLEVVASASEESSLTVFYGTPGNRSFHAERSVSRALRKGDNHVRLPLNVDICRIRLDFGSSSGQKFRVSSLALRRGAFLADSFSLRCFVSRTAVLLVLFCAIGSFLLFPAGVVLSFADRHRYLLSVFILAFAVLFKFNGTSMDNWNTRIANPRAEAPIFGSQLRIRSDEYALFTPLAMSQAYNGYGYFSSIPRGAVTDMFSVYAQPVMHPLVVFRPFLSGYLLLGTARGMSFFWVARWLALLLVMYELFKIVSGGDRRLAGFGALSVAFAPIVHWWGAINALTEMLVFGGLFVVCLHRFMRGHTLADRAWPVAGMAYSGVAYAMALYPAAMVPLAYVFAALSLWVAVDNAKGFRIDFRTIAFSVLAVLVAAGCLGWYLFKSQYAFRAVAETVYPGRRIGLGGDFLRGFGMSWGNLLFPWLWDDMKVDNAFRLSAFVDFFPLGIVLALVALFRVRKKDLLLVVLLAVVAFVGLYCALGFPRGLAAATQMSRSTGIRAFLAVGFAQILLLVRALRIRDTRRSWPVSLALSAVLAAFCMAVCCFAYRGCFRLRYIAILLPVAVMGFWCVLNLRRGWMPGAFLLLLMFACGAFVNPVQRGDAKVGESALACKIRQIARSDKGLWLVDDSNFPITNYPMMFGAPTVNSTNVYPLRERWLMLDPLLQNEEIWNRYSHIRIVIKKGGEPDLALLGVDYVKVGLPNSDVARLGVKYVLSPRDLAPVSDAEVEYKRIFRSSDHSIYAVVTHSPMKGAGQ